MGKVPCLLLSQTTDLPFVTPCCCFCLRSQSYFAFFELLDVPAIVGDGCLGLRIGMGDHGCLPMIICNHNVRRALLGSTLLWRGMPVLDTL
jgi:hypothetical protein